MLLRRGFQSTMRTRKGCERDCGKCPGASQCLEPKALTEPIPRQLWYLLGGSAVLYATMTVVPEWSAKLVEGANVVGLASSDIQENVRTIMHSAGLVDSDKVLVMVTKTGTPHVIGLPGPATTKILLLPEEFGPYLAQHGVLTLTDEIQDDRTGEWKTVTVYEGDVDAIPVDLRKKFLHDGMIIPTRNEVAWIIGHEAVHLTHMHSLLGAFATLSTFTLSHLFIKLYANLQSKFSSTAIKGNLGEVPFEAMKRGRTVFGMARGSHTLAAAAGSIGLGLVASWWMERQADIVSAQRLQLQQASIDLVEKKILQNQIIKQRYGDKTLTRDGNDLTELTHPSNTTQLQYLRETLNR